MYFYKKGKAKSKYNENKKQGRVTQKVIILYKIICDFIRKL